MWLLFPNILGALAARRTNLRHNRDLEQHLETKKHAKGAAVQKYAEGAATDVYYIPELLDRFKMFAIQQQAITDHRHDLEIQRLNAAISNAPNVADKALLNESVHSNLEFRLEAQNAYLQMLNFVNTLKAVTAGSDSSARTCKEITCGQYAICEEGTYGAKCKCEEGFDGNGFECFPPDHFTALSLVPSLTGVKPNVKELHLTVFNDVHLAVAYRDASQNNRGFVMVGRAGLALVKWGKPTAFSGKAKAYSPVIAGVGTESLLIGYRDADKGGSAYIVSGALNFTDQYSVLLSEPEVFARNQAQKMTILQLPHGRAAIFYAERIVDAEGNVLEAYGGACLAQVALPSNRSKAPSKPEVMGKYRFSEVAASRLSATLLSDTSFVVAYRGMTEKEGPPYREASVVWGQMKDGELAFSPNPVSLDPETPQIWERAVAVVSANMFTYSYYCGVTQELKMTVVRIDPATHQMTITDGPRRVSAGKTEYVGAINVPATPYSPHSYTYFAAPGEGVGTAKVCRVSELGRITDCAQRPFAGYDVSPSAVSGQLLWDGRLIFAYATKKGEPYYQVEALFAGESPSAARISPKKPWTGTSALTAANETAP